MKWIDLSLRSSGLERYCPDPVQQYVVRSMSVSDLYKQVVIDHNREPRNYGELADATHTARGLNALCGDDIRVSAVVQSDRRQLGLRREVCA